MDSKNTLNVTITRAEFEKRICNLDKGYKVDKTDDNIFVSYKGQDVLRVSSKVRFLLRPMSDFGQFPKEEDVYDISSLLADTPLNERE